MLPPTCSQPCPISKDELKLLLRAGCSDHQGTESLFDKSLKQSGLLTLPKVVKGDIRSLSLTLQEKREKMIGTT